jgi:hypothetical protein
MAGAEGIRFYILGPPRDADMKFFKISEEEDEMYKVALAAKQDEDIAPVDNDILTAGIALKEDTSPFSAQYHLHGKDKDDFMKEYESPLSKWRQIETDWLESAASIAMRVTRLTNNTSLVIALEFTDSHRVILLPADAQSGNWMGWHKDDVSRKLKQDGGLNTTELLRNTVLYKVGHHGSHNGTASKSGLDVMNNKDLVAMMPLVQSKVPPEWGGSKNFPAKALYNVLIDKTKGRVIRTDQGLIKAVRAKKLRDELSAADKKELKSSFKKGDCFTEFEVKG